MRVFFVDELIINCEDDDPRIEDFGLEGEEIDISIFGNLAGYASNGNTTKVGDDWVFDSASVQAKIDEFENSPSQLKLKGVEIEGVMCSATSEDMWGLKCIEDDIEAGGTTTFQFTNGNELQLRPDNIEDFKAIWVPFRKSFFKP